jgi:hypothetical protein
MMEAARTSETLVNFYQITRRYHPEDSHPNENVLFFKFIFCSIPSLFRSHIHKMGGKEREVKIREKYRDKKNGREAWKCRENREGMVETPRRG